MSIRNGLRGTGRAAVALALAGLCAATAFGGGPPGTDPECFDPTRDGDVLALVSAESRTALEESLQDAGRNWTELAEAVGSLDGEQRESCVWLINTMPHLDRLEMTAATLTEHVVYAYRTLEDMPYDVPEDKFRPYILTYRIEQEPVEAWRASLFERFAPVAERERSAEGTARAINEELAAAVTKREREFFGPRQPPLFTLASGRGTEAEISILACAAMKAVGIPSRQVSVPALGSEEGGASWVEVFTGERWLPLYPLEPEAFGDFGHIEEEHWRNVTIAVTQSAFERVLVTEDYTETGTIELSFVTGGRPAAGFEHFAVSVLNRGALAPLDELEAVADDSGRFSAVVGNGRYVVQAGIRDKDGNSFVMMEDVILVPGATRALAFDVSPGGRERRLDPEELKEFEGAVAVWVAFDLESEPCRRMLPLIASALRRRAGQIDATFAYMGTDPDNADDARGILGSSAMIRVLRDPSEWYYLDERGGRHPIGPGAAELPVVRVYRRHGGDLILHSEGYDLNIERRMSDGIDDYLEELLNK